MIQMSVKLNPCFVSSHRQNHNEKRLAPYISIYNGQTHKTSDKLMFELNPL